MSLWKTLKGKKYTNRGKNSVQQNYFHIKILKYLKKVIHIDKIKLCIHLTFAIKTS